jgi:hypothetical protein
MDKITSQQEATNQEEQPLKKENQPDIHSDKQEYIFAKEEMPIEIFGVKISENDRENLSKGLPSSLLENLQLQDGRIIDGKLSFKKDKETGEINAQISEKKPDLNIGNKFLTHSFTIKERTELEQGRAIGPLTVTAGLTTLKDIFLQVDRELNRIVVKSNKELGVFDKIGGYKLSNNDKNLLANNEKMPPRVYKGKDGKYFTAEIKITDDKKGIEYNNVKMLTHKQALELQPKLNADHDLSTVAGTFEGKELIKANKVEEGKEKPMDPKTHDENKESSKEKSTKNENESKLDQTNTLDDKHQRAIVEASQDNNITLLKELSNTHPPTEKTINEICTSKNLTKNQKLQHVTILKEDPLKHLSTINSVNKEAFKKKVAEIKSKNLSNNKSNNTKNINKETQIAHSKFNRNI